MKHVHHELLIALAEDADTKFEYKDYTGKWSMIQKECIFYPEQEYRIHDPYREFKEAIAAGKGVQMFIGYWYDGSVNIHAYRWVGPVECYRIKPEPDVKTTKNIIVNDTGKTGGIKCTWHDDVLVNCEVVK